MVRGWKGDGGREGRGERGGRASGDKEEVRMFPFRSFDPDMKDVSTRTKYSEPDNVPTRGNYTHILRMCPFHELDPDTVRVG